MEDLAFLQAVLSAPEDDLPRLVYADWLEERADPRAEYLRLEVEHYRSVTAGKRGPTAFAKQLNERAFGLDPSWLRAMSSARHLPKGGRLEVAFVEEGKGLIEVRSGPGETLLMVEGKSVALNWDDCQGSVGQYLVFTGHTRGKEYGRRLKKFVEGEGKWERTLTDQIWPLLSLFTSGAYLLLYTTSAANDAVGTVEYSTRTATDNELVNYYPFGMRNLVCTQTSESLSRNRVARFRKQIRAGHFPIVLTASAGDAWCEFVIDGHHKLVAYNSEGVRPAILCISVWRSEGISLSEGLECMPRGHPGIPEYRRMKQPPRKR